MASRKRMTITGSEKKKLSAMKAVGNVDQKERIEITVMLRPRASVAGSEAARANSLMEMGAQLPEDRSYVSREEFAAQRGADPDDIAKVDAFAHEHNLTVVETSLPKRTIKLAGTVADLTSAFKPNLKKYEMGGREFRGRTGSLSVPEELADIIVAVFGFDNRPVATPHYRRLDDGVANLAGLKASAKKAATKKAGATPMNAADGSFTPPEVARLYNFPAGLDGTGQCIALIELNDFDKKGKITGTGFGTSDLKAYFKKLNLPLPQVTAVGVDGGANKPGTDPNADGEVMLDIEVAGAVAPGAKIAVYFAPNTDQGFIDAVNAALHDNARKPSVISISWGGPEDAPFSTQQYLNAFNQILQDASTLGVTVCCASGDNGSSDLPLKDDQGKKIRDGVPHVDFPASSPFVLACGGTKLLGSGTTISGEQVWNEGDKGGSGGGGVSNIFPLPAYQTTSKVPRSPIGTSGRGVPDVAGDADPATGYQVRVGGKQSVFGGTSAVAPLWAGLIALINQRLASLGKKPAGFINPILYAQPGVFHDIVTGNNDIDGKLKRYQSGPGWDACTGLGTPNGAKVMQALGG